MKQGLVIALFALAALGAGCSSSKGSKATDPSGNWLAPSPVLEQQIADEAARLPWTRGIERLEQIRWFAAVGEPAYPTLLGLAADPRDGVAAAAYAALGATGDNRLVPHLQALPYDAAVRGGDLGLERARTLVRLGDWEHIPTLIAGLEDERLYTRSLAIKALTEATGETNNFDPRSSDEDRKRAAQNWRRWWLKRTGDPLLAPGEATAYAEGSK